MRRAIVLLLLVPAIASAQQDATALEASCRNGSAPSCSTLGAMLRPKDPVKSTLFYLRACAEGPSSTNDCHEAGFGIGVLSRSRSGKRDAAGAVNVLSKECDSGDLHACNALATILMNTNAAIVARNPERALEILTRACDGGVASACSNLADGYASGKVVKQDDARANALYEKACNGGFTSACMETAVQLVKGDQKDSKRALPLFRKACEAGDGLGCAALGALYYTGDGVEKDKLEAVRAFKKACDFREIRGCQGLGTIYNEGPESAVDLFKKACGDDRQQCAQFEAFVTGFKAAEQFRKK